MSLLILSEPVRTNGWVDALAKALHQKAPDLDIQVWPQVADPKAVEFALVWTYPHGELRKYPNLKCISSIGAGVDHIVNDPQLPAEVPVVRLVDENLVHSMTQYLIWTVLNQARHFDSYAQSQARSLWTPHSILSLPQIGVMGLGQLGSDVVQKLLALNFKVIGWSRTAKQIPGVETFAGDKQLPGFLNKTDVLICLLPLTTATRHILNKNTFAQLRHHAYIINVARGAHLVEDDLLAALDQQQLSGACLDVFQTEPLPKEHPFWRHPKIKITPHISSVTDPSSAAGQIIENYHRALAGKPLLNVIDLQKGY